MKKPITALKKLTALLLSVLLITASVPAFSLSAYAAETEEADVGATSGTTGDCTWTLDNGVLTISGNGAMDDYEGQAAPWRNLDITEVVIENGVTEIGELAFCRCRSLGRVTIADSVKTIKSDAFGYCDKLTDITIPNSVTSIGEKAFNMCKSLQIVNIPDSVTRIENYAFYNCNSLKYIFIPESVTSMGKSLFYLYASILTISGKHGSCAESYANEYNIDFADQDEIVDFGTTGDCLWLVDVNGVLTIKGNGAMADYAEEASENAVAPWRKYNIVKAEIKGSLTNIGEFAFEGTKLESLTIQGSITEIKRGAFSNCTSLETITIPNTVTAIGEAAFYNCPNLTIIGKNHSYAKTYANSNNIPFVYDETIIKQGTEDNFTWTLTDANVLRISGNGAMEDYDTARQPIEVPPDDDDDYHSVYYYLNMPPWYYSKDKVEEVLISDGITHIGRFAFERCNNLDLVSLPDSLTSIGSGAFRDCNRLTSITIPDGVTSIGYTVFEGCYSLTEVNISDSVESIYSHAFKNCTNLKRINIPEGIKNIDESLFENCKSLSEITIPNSVESIGSYAFSGCTNLEKIIIPKGVNSIESFAFLHCPSLTIYGSRGSYAEAYANQRNIPFEYIDDIQETGECSWTYNNKNGVLTIFGSGAMADYNETTSPAPWADFDISKVVVEDGVTRVGSYAFSSCNFAEIELPDSLTSIGLKAFARCTELTSINIPKSVTTIDYCVFNYCDKLTCITVDEENPKYDSRNNCNAINETADNALVHGCNATVIPNTIKYIGSAAFAGCKGITEIKLPKGLESIGISAFESCENLENVVLPNNLTSIGNEAFKHCTALKSIKLPYGLTSLRNIFNSCSSLETITIPDGVTSISKNTFANCDSLEDVYFLGTEESWNKISVGANNEKLASANIHFISLGDIDSDGSISINDCTALQSYLAFIRDLTDDRLAAADTNGDGYVDIIDVTHLQKYIAGFNVVLGKAD